MSKKGRTYSVMLTLTDDGEVDLDHSSCTCLFGSFYRFAGHWKEKNKLCWHMRFCIDEVTKLTKEVKENGRKTKNIQFEHN